MSKIFLTISDEQEKVFWETSKRKIILSTNIAESSITINNVYYVIDFCLVKELKFNVRTNHQTLDLNWASKASSNQRSGRAGRVGQGFVFRLVPQRFYENVLESFTNPEILRVPLEKLILKIKIWESGEPQKILGCAIQPPDLRHIETAIKNLQNYGALTLANEKSKTGVLTELGKVYSELPIDIKFSRLIMLAYAFDLLEPAIVSSSIMSQEKNIFKKADSSNNLYEIKNFFSNNSNSDVVMQFNAFTTWECSFGSEYHRTEYDRRLYRKNILGEKEMCQKYNLSGRILKEVLTLNSDIKTRLKKLNLINDSEYRKNINSEQDITLFKLILAGAFFGNYIRCQYSDVEKLKKLKNSKSINYKLNQSVMIKNISTDIPNEQLQNFLMMYGKHKNMIRLGEDIVVEYDDLSYLYSIKKILTLGSNHKVNDAEFSIEVQSNRTNYRVKKPDYPFETKLYDVFTCSQVEIEFTSLNHVILEDKDTEIGNHLYVAEDYFPKHGKLIARNTTQLPKKRMLDILIMLIFAPHANFYSNQEKNQYASFRVVGSDAEFRFSHLFSGCDIDEINKIRYRLNNIIASKNISENKSVRALMIENLFKLINKDRIKIISNEYWWDLFFRFYPEKKHERELYYRDMELINNDENNDIIENISHNYNNYQHTDHLHQKKLEKHSNDFLPPLIKLKIKEDYRLWSPEGIQSLQDEMKLFERMRDEIIKNINDTKKIIGTDKAEIHCGFCSSYICAARNLKLEKAGLISLSGWISGFTNLIPQDPNKLESNSFELTFKNEFSNLDGVKWVACKANNHIIGINLEDVTYITSYSTLRVCYPTLVTEKWGEQLIKNNFELIFNKEKHHLKQRDTIIKNKLYCCLCDKKIGSQEDYIHHVNKENEHKKLMAEFLEEVFTEQIFT